MHQCTCRHCGKDYIATHAFRLQYICRGCASEGKIDPVASPRRKRRSGRTGRERKNARAALACLQAHGLSDAA
jgi:hypothetical protein